VTVLQGGGAGGIGDGTFFLRTTYYSVAAVRDLKVADFDHDGRADLGAALENGSIQYFYGDGSATEGNGRFLSGPAIGVGGTLSTIEVNAFDATIGSSMPIVAQSDMSQIVAVVGGCTGGTGQTLDLTYPNGDETLQLTTDVPVQWTRGPLVMAVHVEVSRDDGVHWERLASNLTGTEYRWRVTAPGSLHARVRVVDANLYTLGDTSNDSFQMLPLVDAPWAMLLGQPSFSSAYPNPARGPAHFDLRLPEQTAVTVEVFDLAGRRVRRLARGPMSPGEHRIVWDGRDDSGTRALDGIYFVRARMDRFEAVRRVVRIE
jgi:hypothetical protein